MLEMFGLSHVKDEQIGNETVRGISGGQRKRVSIAMEFVCRPALLFLDEPTSGLDSTTSHAVVKLITANAHHNLCTTAAVIHQPRLETLMEFDYVILLATGGFLTYAGSTRNVATYFSNVLKVTFPPHANPADVMMDAMTLDSAADMAKRGLLAMEVTDVLRDHTAFGQHLARAWSTSAVHYAPSNSLCIRELPDLIPERSRWGVIWLAQLLRAAVQSRRAWRHHLRMNILQMAGTFVVSIGIPRENSQLVFFQASFAFLFLMLAQAMAAQRTFGGEERVIAWRESGVRVSTFFYFLGHDVISLVEIGAATSFFTLVYWPLGPLLCTASQMYAAVFAFIYATYGYSFLLSALLEPSSAQMVSVLLSFLFWFTSGAQVPEFNFWARLEPFGVYLMALSPIRWAHGYLFYNHMDKMEGNQFRNPLLNYFVDMFIKKAGYNIAWIESDATDWSCQLRLSVHDTWTGQRTRGFGDDRSQGEPIGFNCSTLQLVLLGLLLRVTTVVAMAALCRVKSQGGGELFEGKKSNSFFHNTFSVSMRSLFYAFFIVLWIAEAVIMLEIKR